TLIRLDLKGMLESAGLEVCAEARDGVEAVELAGSESPDIAVLDVKMPRLDGIEAARRILDARPIPIVIVSAVTERSLVRRAADAGVYGYLAKPARAMPLPRAVPSAATSSTASPSSNAPSHSATPTARRLRPPVRIASRAPSSSMSLPAAGFACRSQSLNALACFDAAANAVPRA